MASPNHSLPSPNISDVMNLLYTMKKQNYEILAKLNSIEDDNRKLRQELLEIKSSLKLNNNIKVSSRKRDEPEHLNKQSNTNNKKARVSVVSLPEVQACFNTMDDDCLGNVLDFVGKKSYSAFGRVNKRCHEMFCLKGLPKEAYLFGYGPLRLIQERREWNFSGLSKGVLHYNRRDILEWILTDESDDGYRRLKWLCIVAIGESRLDILREVFQRANERQLECLRDRDEDRHCCGLCAEAAEHGKLECLKFLRLNECGWNRWTWSVAKREEQEHILQYLRDNGFPTEWQDESESESESDGDSEYNSDN